MTPERDEFTNWMLARFPRWLVAFALMVRDAMKWILLGVWLTVPLVAMFTKLPPDLVLVFLMAWVGGPLVVLGTLDYMGKLPTRKRKDKHHE